MKTKTLLATLIVGAFAATACMGVSEEDADAAGQAAMEQSEDDFDDFTVEDRMGRPEMTNVTMGAALVRVKVLKTKLETLQAQAAAETDATRKAAIVAEAQKVGGELQRLAPELAPESDELKKELAKDAALAAADAKAIEDAKASGQAAPVIPRRAPGYFRAYNHQITFHPKPGERSEAKRLLAAGIRALDTVSLDGQTADAVDWSEDDVQAASEILAEDALVVDIGADCTHDTQSYFAIEREALQRPEEAAQNVASCGGRTLNDDIIDDTLTMWIKRSFDFRSENPLRVGDNVVVVSEAKQVGPFRTSPVIAEFPYLGEPRSAPFVGAGACSGKC